MSTSIVTCQPSFCGPARAQLVLRRTDPQNKDMGDRILDIWEEKEWMSSELGQEKVVLNLFENGFSARKRVEISDILPGCVELDFNYKSTFICNGAERKEGIKSDSSGDFRGGEHGFRGHFLIKGGN